MSLYPAGTFRYAISPYDTIRSLAQRYNTSTNAIIAINPGIDPSYLRVGQIINICPGYEYCSPSDHPPYNYPYPGCISKGQLNLINLFRMLWEQHTVWTKMTIMSIVEDLPNERYVTARLLQNPKDFGKALEPFYGDKIASKFSDLLSEHLVIAAQLVKASKAGDTKTADELEKAWYANADEIALLLGSINPYWSTEEWRRMLYHHLALVKAEAVAFLNQNFEETIKVYDELERQALEMADLMSKGIIKQFPKMTI